VSDAIPKPLPHPDRDSEPYWKALSQGRFQLQRCGSCNALRWPPRALCNRCVGFEFEWVDVATTGRIVSWTRTHQVFAPAYRGEVPYTTVAVALDAQEDISMIGGWSTDRDPRAGETVRIRLVDAPEGFKLPCWEPA